MTLVILTDVGPIPADILCGEWPTSLTRQPRSVMVHDQPWGLRVLPAAEVTMAIQTYEGYATTARRVMAVRRERIDSHATSIDSAQVGEGPHTPYSTAHCDAHH